MAKKNTQQPQEQFKTMIGGQALIEGIMMLGPEKSAVVVRTKAGLQRKVAPRQQGIADVHIAVEMQNARDAPRRSGQQHRPQRRRAAEALQQPCHRRPHEPDYAARERQAGDHVRPCLLVPDATRARNGQQHAP